MRTPNSMLAMLAIASATVCGSALADPDHHHDHGGQVQSQSFAFGQPGNAHSATRTIRVEMNDDMRFTPSKLAVKQGETVKFVIANRGQAMHEMVLGTMEQLKAHGKSMQQHPGMEHDEPFMAHVAPGQTQEMIWRFTKRGSFNYGCLVPGHFESGMVGTITVQ